MSQKQTQFQFYNIEKTIKKYPDAYYYVIYGERSNGKTYSALSYALKKYHNTGEQFAYVRRFQEDIRKKHMSNLFSGHIEHGLASKYSNGEYDNIEYANGKFYFSRLDDELKLERAEEPIGYAFDLNSMEHYKSTSFPKITTVIFDEFLSRQGYLPNEFLLFSNTLSTIIRLRTNVKIFMLGNTVNKYCPYFAEMGLIHVKEQKQGTTDLYKYSDTGLQVVVEYCSSSAGTKASDVYFAFDNPQLQMIKTGAWEIAIYPHLPIKYKPREVVANFFIEFDGEVLHGEIISPDNGVPFTFLHRKTTPIHDYDNDIVYRQKPSHRPNIRVGFQNYRDKISQFIVKSLREYRIFYATNEDGEIFRNYIIWSTNNSIRSV